MDRLIKAFHYSSVCHRTQRRKNSDKDPYINHPIDVANLLTTAGVTDVDVIIAGVLHDTVEDTGSTYAEITDFFGKKVADIVMECSDDKSLAKEVRKQKQIEHASVISKEAKLVKLADKYSNLRDLHKNPPSSWSPKEIEGYFIWAYMVVSQMRGVNQILEAKLDAIFEEQGILAMSEQMLKEKLEEYYSNIKMSE